MGVMDERSSRLFVGICLLVLLWIGTYWLYEPGGRKQPTIRFDPATATDTPQPPPSGPVASNPIPPVRFEPVVPPTRTDPGLRVEPPDVREYIIRPGDTLESIARDQLGSASLASAIARANPLKDPRRLRVGEMLRIPVDPDNIQGRVVREDGTPPEQPVPIHVPPVVEYRVKAGDTLSRIAQSYYGSVRHADFIFRANRDILSSPDSLRVGQTLKLPPLPTEPEG